MPCEHCEGWYKMWKESVEMDNHPLQVKAIEFAHANPGIVYGYGTEEYEAVRHDGFFNIPRPSLMDSASASERT